MKHAAATLGSGNLRLAVMLPEGEDLNEWVAVNSESQLALTIYLVTCHYWGIVQLSTSPGIIVCSSDVQEFFSLHLSPLIYQLVMY